MLHATSCVASAPASLCNGHSHTLNTPTRHRQGWGSPRGCLRCPERPGAVSVWISADPSPRLQLRVGQLQWRCRFPALSPERAALALVISLPGMQEASGASESRCLQWAGRQGASAQPLFGAAAGLLPAARGI